jgi:hypothetical protein
MAKSTTDNSITRVSIARANDAMGERASEFWNLTEVLRRALIAHPGQAGALGDTWTARGGAERQAAQFCHARPGDCVASAEGDYYARIYELPGDRWGVVVWYDMVG